MNHEELETLREGWDFEAKLASGGVPASLWETYSAMANTSGGVILLGAKELNDGSLELRGIRNVEKFETDFWNLLENPQKVSANILQREDVEQLQVDGASLILIRVPKAPRSKRPVFINDSWENGTYMRVHEGDRPVTTDVARRMLADALNERDGEVLEDFTPSDLSESSVRRYREFFAVRRPEHVYLEKNDEGFLLAAGVLKKRRGGDGVARPTLAGLLMLGDELAIRDLLPHWNLSYKELPDDPQDPRRWLDRIYPDGTWNANLFEFYLRVIIKLHDGLKVPFNIEQGQFRKDETPIHVAIREALVNTLIHADYRGTTGVRIVKRRGGFEFINPGLLLVSAEQLWRGGISEPRNPMLHRLFGLPKLGEREGSGGPTMRKVWRKQHWRAPRVWEDVEYNETHLELRLESLFPQWATDQLLKRWGKRFSRQDELGRIILVTAEVEGTINHATIASLTDQHSRDITLKFQELVRKRLLESEGARQGTTYSPGGPEALPLLGESRIADAEISSPQSPPQSSPQSSPQSFPQSKEDVAPEPDIIERVAKSTWAPSEDVRRAILELCRNDFKTANEIAKALNRKGTTIQQNYISKMVQEEVLEPRFPTPSHPAQAYRLRTEERTNAQ